MPLNAIQKEIIAKIITEHIDAVLKNPAINGRQKIECLQSTIADIKINLEKAIQVLKENPALTSGLVCNINVPQDIRAWWQKLLIQIQNKAVLTEAVSLLKKLPAFNNYNPLTVVEMCLFESEINCSEFRHISKELIFLREAYLEMTPLVSWSPAKSACYYIRIGAVPFGLETFGLKPQNGEVRQYIKKLITEKLQKMRQDQKEEAEEQARLYGSLSDELTEEEMKPRYSERVYAHQSFVPVFTTRNDRLFQMQSSLNNEITVMMNVASTKMHQVGMTLNRSKGFLELRVAECCNVLASVLLNISMEHCSDETKFNADEINSLYQSQLSANYEMYLEDMVAKWIEERKKWVSDSNGALLTQTALTDVSNKFKQEIQNSMSRELKEFKLFSFKELTVRKNFTVKRQELQKNLVMQKEYKLKKALQCKEKWETACLPLMELADHCNQLRELRSQVQKNECTLEEFNLIVTKLSTLGDELDLNKLFRYACWGGNLTLVKELLSRGVRAFALPKPDEEGDYTIHLAVENESQVTLELLETLNKNLPDNFMKILEVKNTKNKKTFLHVAAAFGNLTPVQWIVDKLSTGKELNLLDIQVEDGRSRTPLHYAAREGQEAVVNFLLSLGADKLIKFEDRSSPLVLAIEGGHIGVARLFFKHGIWLTYVQKEHLKTVAEASPDLLKKIEYCFLIPTISGLPDLKIYFPNWSAQLEDLVSEPLLFDYSRGSTPRGSLVASLYVDSNTTAAKITPD